MKRKNHIEFIGLCGAGKSSLIHLLQSAALMESGPVSGVWLKPSTPSRWRYRWVAFYLINKLIFHRPQCVQFFREKKFRLLLKKISYRYASLALNKKRQGKLLFQDCGLFQPLIDYALRHNVNQLPYIDYLLAVLPKPGMVIVVNAAVPVAVERFRQRENQTLLEEPDLINRFFQAHTNCKIMCDYFVRDGVKVIYFDANAELTLSAAKTVYEEIVAS